MFRESSLKAVHVKSHAWKVLVSATLSSFIHLPPGGLSFSSYFAPSTSAQLAPSRQPARGSQLEDVEYGACQWKEGFWKERQSVCFEKSIPAMWEIMTDDRRSQFLTNFKIANGQMQGKHRGPSWNDGDFYKWIEAASVACFLRPDEELSQHLDSAIEVIGKAQAPNGYIHTPVQIRRLAGDEKAIPFLNLFSLSYTILDIF